jgi:hypothetical protein
MVGQDDRGAHRLFAVPLKRPPTSSTYFGELRNEAHGQDEPVPGGHVFRSAASCSV